MLWELRGFSLILSGLCLLSREFAGSGQSTATKDLCYTKGVAILYRESSSNSLVILEFLYFSICS